MKPTALSLAFVAAGALAVAAQQPPPPVFRSEASLVEVDVVVRDKSGRFVSDLAPGDFEIREQGDPQPIQQFFLRVTSSNGWPVDSTPAAGQASTAVPAPPATARRTFIAIFDDAHMTAGGFKRTQAAVAQLFSQHFRVGDLGGVVIGGRMVNNRLTNDRDELLKAVKNAKPGLRKNSRVFDEQQWPRVTEAEALRIAGKEDQVVLSAAVTRACSDDEGACKSMLDVAGLIRQKAAMLVDNLRTSSNATVHGLTAIMNGLTRFEGRKTVLLLSEGFQADDSWALVEQAVGSAARANARIYTLDARGLDRTGMAERLSGANTSGDDGLLNLLNGSDGEADAINSLAADTGGFVVRNSNIFDRAIARIVDDSSNYYVLAYRPTTTQDGAFHKISVTVNRADLSVRARRGYYATPRPAPTVTEPTRTDASDLRRRDAAPGEPVVRVEPRAPAPDPRDTTASEATATAAPSPPAGMPAARDEARLMTVRLRPDAVAHVEALVKESAVDSDATAGWAAYQRGDVDSAAASLSKAVAHADARPWVFYALGQSEYALARYRDAALSWEKVHATTPEFKPVYFDLVDAYLQLKDYDKGIRLLRDADKRWKRDSEILNALGVVQVARGSLDDAVQSFTQATAAAPGDGTGYFNLAKALELRYWKNRRFVQQTQQWMANGNDRNAAIENYKRYLEIGGSLETAARNGLSRLEWTPGGPR